MQAAAEWLFWPPPSCSGSIPGTCPHAACKSVQPGLRQHRSHKTPLPGPPEWADQRQTDANEPALLNSVCNSLPRRLYEIEWTPSFKHYHPFPCTAFLACCFLHMCVHVCMHVHMLLLLQMMPIRAQLHIHQRRMLLGVINAAVFPHLAPPQLVCRSAPQSHWHQGIPSIAHWFPYFTSTPASTEYFSHNYRFLLDVSVCNPFPSVLNT